LLLGKLAGLRTQDMQYRFQKKTNVGTLATVLKFPNVKRAMKMISIAVELQRLEFGFRVWKSIKSPLTRRELQKISEIRRNRSSVVIQRIWRGSLCRARVKMLLKKKKRYLQLKKDALSILRRGVRNNKKVRSFLTEKTERKRQFQAVVIQKFIRGFFGRAVVKLMARNRLVEALKKWSNGNTLSLLKRPALQDTSSQLYLEVIINVAQCSSRPVKRLPKIAWFDECVTTIAKLMELEKIYKLSMQKEYANRQFERLHMISEDKESIMHSRLYNRIRREMAEAAATANASRLRDNSEKLRRALEAATKAALIETARMLTDMELMKIEDWRSSRLSEYR